MGVKYLKLRKPPPRKAELRQNHFESEAEKFGIDVQMLEHNLSLSFEARLEQHQQALTLYLELEKAKARLNARSK